jgi:uncharacterized protein (TIGR02285 family)
MGIIYIPTVSVWENIVKRFLQVCAVFATLLSIVPPIGAQHTTPAKPELTWLSIDWQPAWINEGPLSGEGYAQTVVRLLKDQLTDYAHIDRSVTNVRIYSVLQNREACFAASPYQGKDIQEEKRKGVIWSAPAYLYFYHGIIANPEGVALTKRHDKEGYIDLAALMADETIKGAFQPGRSYSRWLNPIFADESKTKNMFKWAGETQLTQSMFKLADAGRIDYFVDYVIMLKFHQATTSKQSDYIYLPILEHKEKYGLGAIACSDTPLGRKAIADINRYLVNVRREPELMDINRRWLMPEGQEELYWATWEKEVLTRDH